MSELRETTWRDIPVIAGWERELFGGDAWSEATWWAELAGRPRREYLVLDGDGIEGYAGLDHGGEVADVMTVAVVPPCRGRGLGDRLVEALLDRAGARGASAVMLEVRADNAAALRLYRRHGFEEVSVRARYYQPEGVDEHARFGGVVPEVASRAHLEAMVPTIERACATSGVALGDVDAVAVTSGPGLAGALMVGVAAAKALAVGLGKPLYGVNHLASHVAVDVVEHGPLPEPCLALLVSGGHSSLLLVPDVTTDVRPLGATIDDAAGEAFDKVARVLGLPFPGGPHIDRAAREGDSVAIDFPRGLTAGKDLERHRFDFSFSGLKTAVSRWVSARESAGEPVPVADVAASFQEAVVDVLTRKALAACRAEGVSDLLVGGGVAANSRLRAMAAERCEAAGVRLRVPRPGLCTDNGAMVAALGSQMVSRGVAPSALDVPADSSMPVTLVRG